MASPKKLTATELRHLRRLTLFQRQKRFQVLARCADQATVRVAQAIKQDPKHHSPGHLRWLAEVSQHEARAYGRLSHRAGALRYCVAHIEHALRHLKLNKV